MSETRDRPPGDVEDVDAFDMLGAWLDWLEGRDLSEHTVQLYVYGVFRLFRMHHFPSPGAVGESHIAAFLKSLKGRDTARVHYFRGVRSAFGYWRKKGWIPTDPTMDFTLRKPRRPPRVALEESELIRYLVAAAWRDPRRAWTLLLCFGVGMRRMEAAAVKPEDVLDSEIILRHCKYGKERRVDLSRYARIALEELKPWSNGTVLGGIDCRTITEWAHQAAVDSGLAAKVRGRPAHVLRASFASHLLANGVPVTVVRDYLGHESISTTNEYAATLNGDGARYMARLNFGSSSADT
jgi:integrase